MGYAVPKLLKEPFLAYTCKLDLPFLRDHWPHCGCLPPPRLWLSPIRKETIMVKKKILNPDRVRRIEAGFSFIPHRFVCDGFLASLEPKQLLLYLFLVIVADRYGLSFYSYDTICTLLQMELDQYTRARDALIDKDLIAFNGTVFQVLELPAKPVLSAAQKEGDHLPTRNQAALSRLINHTIKSM
jgi:hypothetical protein